MGEKSFTNSVSRLKCLGKGFETTRDVQLASTKARDEKQVDWVSVGVSTGLIDWLVFRRCGACGNLAAETWQVLIAVILLHLRLLNGRGVLIAAVLPLIDPRQSVLGRIQIVVKIFGGGGRVR